MEPEFKAGYVSYEAWSCFGTYAIRDLIMRSSSWGDVKAAGQKYARETGDPVVLKRFETIRLA